MENLEKQVFTTGQVARICQVSAKTVKKWIDSGKLPGYRMPSSGDRRVTREALMDFMHTYKLPTGMVEEERRKVLVVDDEPELVEVISRALESAGPMDVRTASSGYEALLSVGAWQPDLIIMDLKMPGLDGFEACRRIRALPQTSQVKILMMSAYASPEVIDRARDCGGDDFLAKPFELDVLAKKACDLLGIHTFQSPPVTPPGE